MATRTANFYDVLQQRGLVAQSTDERMRERLARPVSAYCGFDPTADSLHVGSLVPIMALAHLQRCGHRPIVLVGGATGRIGDPSGKTEARQMLTVAQIEHNVRCIGAQIGRIVRFDDSPTGGVLVNNYDWLGGLNWIDLLREYGPHFSVNRMLTMDSVKNRLESAAAGGGGLTFLEFNYMVMQAIDFLHLHREYHCTLQMGGQDQWGNIVMGVELCRRIEQKEVAGLTFPLVTRADGTKFGKSEKGNVWLDPRKSSPYEFYQFWRNTADADVAKFLAWFTFLPMDEVRALCASGGQALNAAKEKLAYEVTKVVHGEGEADTALESSRRAFGGGDVTGDAIPSAPFPPEGGTIVELLVAAGMAKSNGEAKKLVQGGGVRLHDGKIDDVQRRVTAGDARDGYVVLRVGKKRLFRFDVA